MGLDVYLTMPRAEPTDGRRAADLLRENGFEGFAFELECRHDCSTTDEVYSANITHNLGVMAEEAGIYSHLWRPEEIGITKAAQLIEPLTAGLARLEADPERFRKLNPHNGWGDYDVLVSFVRNYVLACRENPEADVTASR